MSQRVIIVEDEKLTAERLQSLVHKHTSLQVLQQLYSVKSAISWLESNEPPDLIFLDIQLGDGNGFDVLEKLTTYPHVIFTTAFDQYVLDAFKYNSVDYLLKPIKPDELINAVEKFEKIQPRTDFPKIMDQLNAHIFRKYKRKFLVKIGLKYQSIAVEDVAYFFSKEGATYLRMRAGQSLIIDQPLDVLEVMLDPLQFFRVNRHLIVHSDHITSIDSYFNNRLILELKPTFSEQVIVSREKVRAFKDWLDE